MKRIAITGLGILAATAALVPTGPAFAATPVTSVFEQNGTLVVSAHVGQADTVSVTEIRDGILVRDVGIRLSLGSGCRSRQSDALCRPGITLVRVSAGDKDDEVTVGSISGAKSSVDGGEGNDVLTIARGTVHGRDGNDTITSGNRHSDLFGDGDDDVLTAGRRDDDLNGGDGNDLLFGKGGHDKLSGGGGNDMLSGGGGNDRLDGGPGPLIFPQITDNDTLFGGAGRDRVDYSARTTSVDVDPDGIADDGRSGSVFAEKDNVSTDVESATGGRGDDILIGNSARNTLDGGPGADTLEGRAGDDRLIGGAGNDTLTGGDDRDTLEGNNGRDILRAKDLRRDVIKGGKGADDCTVDKLLDTFASCLAAF